MNNGTYTLSLEELNPHATFANRLRFEIPCCAPIDKVLVRFLPFETTMDWATLIVRSPRVCGNDARIKGTRLPVWALESSRRVGFTKSQQLERYPFISAEQLDAAYQYAAMYKDEIDHLIRANEED